MTQTLIFVRHGETVHNRDGVTQGWCDSDLTELGIEQAGRVARRVREFAPTALYTSSLGRAVATARAIERATGLLAIPLDDLREMHCGQWEGRPFLGIRDDYYRKWISDPTVPCPEGESLADVGRRIGRALTTIQEQLSDSPGPVVVVSHGTAIRLAVSVLLEAELRLVRSLLQDNASISIFERQRERWMLRTWNEITHLNGAGSVASEHSDAAPGRNT